VVILEDLDRTEPPFPVVYLGEFAQP